MGQRPRIVPQNRSDGSGERCHLGRRWLRRSTETPLHRGSSVGRKVFIPLSLSGLSELDSHRLREY